MAYILRNAIPELTAGQCDALGMAGLAHKSAIGSEADDRLQKCNLQVTKTSLQMQ